MLSRIRGFISRNTVFVSISALVLSGIILAIIIVEIINLRRSNSFDHYVNRVPLLIMQEDFDAVSEYLGRARDIARSVEEHLGIARYARELSEWVPDLYSEIIQQAAERFPRNQHVRAVQVNTLLEQGNIEAAFEFAQKLKMPEYQSLQVESFLRGGRNIDFSISSSLNEQLPLTAYEMADPQKMIAAGILTNDIRFFVNAGVMYASLGRLRDAFAILMERRDLFINSADAVILLQLAYDLGEYEAVSDILPLIPETIENQNTVNEFLADTYFYLGRVDESFAVHAHIAEHAHSARSYLNQLSLIRAHEYDVDAPIQRTLEKHSRNPAVLAHALAYEADAGNFDSSLAYYRSIYPSINLDWLAHLRQYLFQLEDYRLDDSIVALWSAINSKPDDIAARDLLLYFLKIDGDIDGLRSILQRYNEEYDDRLIFFQAILSLTEGRRDDARKYFTLVAERGNFQASFNLGLLNLEDQNYFQAREWFVLSARQAQLANGFTLKRDGALYRSEFLNIRLYEGLSQLLLGNRERVRRIVSELESADYYHILLPQLREVIAVSNNN
ncbi:MAG: hypothetical protein ACR2PY_09320 [Salinispira sp.]